jgi:hypothetical protein
MDLGRGREPELISASLCYLNIENIYKFPYAIVGVKANIQGPKLRTPNEKVR